MIHFGTASFVRAAVPMHVERRIIHLEDGTVSAGVHMLLRSRTAMHKEMVQQSRGPVGVQGAVSCSDGDTVFCTVPHYCGTRLLEGDRIPSQSDIMPSEAVSCLWIISEGCC